MIKQPGKPFLLKQPKNSACYTQAMCQLPFFLNYILGSKAERYKAKKTH